MIVLNVVIVYRVVCDDEPPNGPRHLLATVRDSRGPQPRHGGESGGRGVRPRPSTRPAKRDALHLTANRCQSSCATSKGGLARRAGQTAGAEKGISQCR